MGANHNIKRYGEVWPSFRMEKGLEILLLLKPYVVISGGWAWHFMSPEGHTEFKHAHDHKDIDIFVHPKNVAQVMVILIENGFQKVWTRYDHMPSQENFRRYEKVDWLANGKQIRITIDFFESSTITTILHNGWTIVEPSTLLGFYSNIHSSDKCWAVKAALSLIEKRINPIGHELLVQNPLDKTSR